MTSSLLDRLQRVLGDQYEVVREVGSGGMATVYLARDLRHGRDVAVKVFRPELSASIGPDRFLREIKIAASLHHPHILHLHDSGAGEGLLYFTMPYVDGESLADRLGRESELPVRDVVRILKNVADGLAYAHAEGLVHRDIKPGNVLLKGRHALIADFGIAKAVDAAADATRMTVAGVGLGTPAFMAPEQVTGEERVDGRADVYALGCLAYAMLTGDPPFGWAAPSVMIGRHVAVAPTPIQELRPAVPEALAIVIMRCLEKKPADRWQSCAEIVEALDAIPFTTDTLPHTLAGEERRWSPRRAVGFAGVVVAVLAAVAYGAGWLEVGGGLDLPSSYAVHKQRSYTGNVVEAVISPDGQFIARIEELDPDYRIVVHDITSGADVEVGRRGEELSRLAWSPDSGRLIVSVNTEDGGPGGSALIYPRLGGEPRPVRGGLSTTWTSVEGQFVMAPENWQGLLFFTTGGGPPRWVGFRETLRLQSGFDERPGGAFYAVAMSTQARDSSQLLSVRIEAEQRAGTGAGDPSAMAPPEVLAEAADLVPDWVREQFVLAEEDGYVESPRWSPEGDALYYLLTQGQTQQLRKVRVAPDGSARGEPLTLLTGLEVSNYWYGRGISLTDDGQSLVYAKGGEFANLWMVDVGGGEVRSQALTRGTAMNTAPKLSPDGTRIAYLAGPVGAADIFVLPVTGRESRRVTFLESVRGEPAWSPDGSALAGTLVQDGTPFVFVVGLDGPPTPEVFDASVPLPAGPYLTWTAAGSIVYTGSGHQDLRVLDPGTGADRSVLHPDSVEVGWIEDHRRHPSEDVVALWWGRFNWPDRGLYTLSLSDGSARRLATGQYWPAGWSPDGRWVYAADQATKSLVRVSVTSGAVEHLADLPGAPQYGQHTLDGTRFVVSIPGVRADVWSIEGFDPERD